MPVPANIAALSTTPASNSPSGSESPTSTDDYLRTVFAFIAQLAAGSNFTGILPIANGGLGAAALGTLASAATTDIGAQPGLGVEITGTTGITSLGTNYRGPRFLRFSGVLTLTHNATTLNLPGAANITTAAGDTCIAMPNSAGNGWNVTQYQRAASLTNGAAASGANGDLTSTSALASMTGLASINGQSISGLRNIITNGNFIVNQRVYVSAAALASGDYGHDFWKGGASGGNYSFTQLSGSTTITIAASKTLIQIISARKVRGSTLMLSWTGTALARVGINSATPSGAYAASPIAITTQTAATVMSVEFGNGASSCTLGEVQLEHGTVATTFENRDFDSEVIRCKSRFQKSYDYGVAAGTVTSTGAISGGPFASGASGVFICAQLPVEMEGAPTWKVYSPGSGASGNINNAGTDRAASISFNSPKTASFANTVATNISVHNAHFTVEFKP